MLRSQRVKEPVTIARTPAASTFFTLRGYSRSGATRHLRILYAWYRVWKLRESIPISGRLGAGFTGRLSRSVLVLIDGRSVYTPLLLGFIGRFRTVARDVDRMKSSGGLEAHWGANAVNGSSNSSPKIQDTHECSFPWRRKCRSSFVNFRLDREQEQGFNYRIYVNYTRSSEFHPDDRNSTIGESVRAVSGRMGTCANTIH